MEGVKKDGLLTNSFGVGVLRKNGTIKKLMRIATIGKEVSWLFVIGKTCIVGVRVRADVMVLCCVSLRSWKESSLKRGQGGKRARSAH